MDSQKNRGKICNYRVEILITTKACWNLLKLENQFLVDLKRIHVHYHRYLIYDFVTLGLVLCLK